MDNPRDLLNEYSPAIPTGFPRDRMPKELCQSSLFKMLVCVQFSSTIKCSTETMDFYRCKRVRDEQIRAKIFEWDQERAPTGI